MARLPAHQEEPGTCSAFVFSLIKSSKDGLKRGSLRQIGPDACAQGIELAERRKLSDALSGSEVKQPTVLVGQHRVRRYRRHVC